MLAAGGGSRYGMPKALVERGGRLLVEHAVGTVRAGGCDPVVVVLGAAAEEVLARAQLDGARPVTNPDWSSGMGSSLRAGLSSLAGAPATSAGHGEPGVSEAVTAALVLLVDTPGVTAAAVARIAALASPDALVAATYSGRRGHPVLLGRAHWAGAAALATGDVGARPYLARHQVVEVPCDDIADDTDLDVPPV